MVQKSEELHESGASPYSDVPCAVVSLASTIVSRGQTELRPDCIRFSCCALTVSASAAAGRVCPLSHTCRDFIIMHAATYYFGFLGGYTFN